MMDQPDRCGGEVAMAMLLLGTQLGREEGEEGRVG